VVDIEKAYKILFGSLKITNSLLKLPVIIWNIILKFIFEKVDLNVKFIIN